MRLLQLMRRRPGLLALSIICGALAALLSLAPYIAAALTVSALFAGPLDWNWVVPLGLASLIAVGLRHLLFSLATGFSHTIAFEVQESLRLALAEKLARVPLGFFDTRSKGELRTLLLDDIETIEDGMAHLVPELSAALIAPLIALLAVAVLDWRLALLALLPLAAGLVLLGRVMKRGEAATHDYLAVQSRMAETVAEMADGLPTVRAFNQHEQATDRTRRVFAEMRQLSDAWMRQAVVPGSAAQVLLSSHLLVAAPVGLVMAAEGGLAPATLAAALAILYGLGDVFGSLQGVSHRLMRQVQLLARIDAVISVAELPAPVKPEQARPVPEGDTSITLRKICFSYGSRQVIDHVDLDVAAGRCVALVGPSGSGKSTLVRLLARFNDIVAGAILIGGVDIRSMSADELNARIGFVFQDVFLFSGTITENIRLGNPAASQEEVERAAMSARAHDFILALPEGYATIIGERGLGLSGGERQRISIARAILKNAPILILDEATAFADPENEALIQDAIAALTDGRTLIVIAHRLHTVMHVDEIVVLEAGRIAQRGTHTSLLAQDGLYARMWAAQQEQHEPRPTAGERELLPESRP